MRVFALSDIHIDYHENEQWLSRLSSMDYQEDILILAGDVTDNLLSSLRYLFPVLGSVLIEEQIRQLKPQIHVYGHSHVNCQMDIKGIKYINNAFGYPYEQRITNKELLCIYER